MTFIDAETIRKINYQIVQKVVAQTHTAHTIIAVPVMDAGFMFTADWLREHYKVARWQAVNLLPVDPKRPKKLPATEKFKDRYVVVLDTICDSGRTLELLGDYFQPQAKKVVLVSLIAKDGGIAYMKNYVDHNPGVIYINGELIADDWVVGYGLDNADGTERDNPNIYATGANGRRTRDVG